MSATRSQSFARSRALLRSSPLALLMLLGMAACGVDQTISLGRFAPDEPPLAGAGGMEISGGAPAPPPTLGGTGGSSVPPPVLDAGRPPPPPAVDAGVEPIDAAAPAAGPCATARSYVGDFSCTLRVDPAPFGAPPPPGGAPPTMTTSIAFGLEPSGDTLLSQVVDSQFVFQAWGLEFMGHLSGQFDCMTGRFDAVIVEGVAAADPSIGGDPSMTLDFFGALQGAVVDPEGGLEGEWWHSPGQDPARGCMGPWTASPLP